MRGRRGARAWLLLAAGCGSFGTAEQRGEADAALDAAVVAHDDAAAPDAADAAASDSGDAAEESCGDGVLVGSNEMSGTGDDPVNQDTLDCYAYSTSATPMTARCVSLYLVAVPSGAAVVHIGVYSNDGGKPSSRLARATLTSPAVGWNRARLDQPLEVPASEILWLGYLPRGSGTVVRHQKGCTAPHPLRIQDGVTDLPMTFVQSNTYDHCRALVFLH